MLVMMPLTQLELEVGGNGNGTASKGVALNGRIAEYICTELYGMDIEDTIAQQPVVQDIEKERLRSSV
jgi:hypothetical protein